MLLVRGGLDSKGDLLIAGRALIGHVGQGSDGRWGMNVVGTAMSRDVSSWMGRVVGEQLSMFRVLQ